MPLNMNEIIPKIEPEDIEKFIDFLRDNYDYLVSMDKTTHRDYEEMGKTIVKFTFIARREETRH